MNTEERLKTQRIIKLIIEGISSKTQEAAKAKDQFRKSMADIDAQRSTYLPDAIERMVEKEKQNLAGKLQALGLEISKRFDDLNTLISERDSTLDLASPALQTALTLIQMTGKDLPFETKKQINANFANDQASLRAIQAAYKASGIVADAGLDKMIYNPGETISKLKEYAAQSFTLEGSLNFFGSELSKFANLEGQPVEVTPDPTGVYEAMRRGAGLSVE